MPGRSRKPAAASRAGKTRATGPSTKQQSPKLQPSELSRLVVQFNRAEDPNIEQTTAIHDLVKKVAPNAHVTREMPGALQIEIHPDSVERLRKEVDALPDWNVATEGTAHMPTKPLLEDLDDGKKHK